MKDIDLLERPVPKVTDKMTPEEVNAEYAAYFKTIFRGYGTPEGAKMANLALGELTGQKPLDLGTKEIERWEAFNKSFLSIAPKIGFRETLQGLVKLHKEQRALNKKKISKFIYDDRGSISTVAEVKLPTGEIVSAKQGSELLNINGYGDVRIVIDVPRPQDNSVRIWTWGGRGSERPESYVFPLNNKARGIGPQAQSTDNSLPYTYRRILDAEAELIKYNNDLKNAE